MPGRIGCEVITANDGISAIKLIDQYANKLDTVILDLLMPGISLGEIASKLRKGCSDVQMPYNQEKIAFHIINNCKCLFIETLHAL